jgi:hypothetical protein
MNRYPDFLLAVVLMLSLSAAVCSLFAFFIHVEKNTLPDALRNSPVSVMSTVYPDQKAGA